MSDQGSRLKSAAENAASQVTGAMLGKAVGVAAAVVAGAVAVTAFRKRGDSAQEESIFHLRQSDEEWELDMEGTDAPKATFATKEEGIAAARELARQSAPCELVIYRTDGSEQDRHTYAE